MTMKLKTCALLATGALAAALAGAAAVGQPTTGTVESHMAMGKVAAGDDNQRLYRGLCEQPAAGPNTGGPRPNPERSTWHVEPVKVRQSLLCRREGIFRLGGQYLRRDHPH
jgi:hypothetical protein